MIPNCSCGAPAAFVSFLARGSSSWCVRCIHDLRGDVGFILAPRVSP